ncbi:MAG: hypothetical protein ACQESK_04655 [Bacteroidota bacterium]
MKIIKFIIVILCISSVYPQTKRQIELFEKHKTDTIFVYLPMFHEQPRMGTHEFYKKSPNYLREKIFYFAVPDSIHGGKQIGFVKSRYMNLAKKVPNLKLIDTTWINNNQDKIVYPDVFLKYQFMELYELFLGKTRYIIEEENFFGEKVYAREVRLYTTYSWEE